VAGLVEWPACLWIMLLDIDLFFKLDYFVIVWQTSRQWEILPGLLSNINYSIML